MTTLKTSCVNSAQSYFTLINYNNIIPGLVVGPKEPAQTPNMNPQVVLNYNAKYIIGIRTFYVARNAHKLYW